MNEQNPNTSSTGLGGTPSTNAVNTPPPAAAVPSSDTVQSAAANTSNNFIENTESKDEIYNVLFQNNGDENNSVVENITQKKSGLQIFTNIMRYISMAIVVVITILFVYVFIQGQESNALIKNYSFLCTTMNAGIVGDADTQKERKEDCKTITMFKEEYDKRTSELENKIAEKLIEYIPLNIGEGNSDGTGASPEKIFIQNIYNNKIDVVRVIEKFQNTQDESSVVFFDGQKNIICKELSLEDQYTFTTQCTVYGSNVSKSSGSSNTKTLQSSRIHATRFVEALANTEKSQFILQDPPTTYSVTEVDEAQRKEFNLDPAITTYTNITLSLRYVPDNDEA